MRSMGFLCVVEWRTGVPLTSSFVLCVRASSQELGAYSSSSCTGPCCGVQHWFRGGLRLPSVLRFLPLSPRRPMSVSSDGVLDRVSYRRPMVSDEEPGTRSGHL
ncbi:hypothetical protein C8T65DRAFT_634727 [Cerioporus squamosus]|nr:hypothetical protein C8T65DRAFT_634727 [Cerioporus squamosus]